jgi:transcriptional regulator with XRE-family HTH domain
MDISERIKARRLELGLTIEDVAKALKVSKGTVSKYETNAIKNMGIDKLESLARILRVSPVCLLGWSDMPVPKSDDEAAAMVKKEGLQAVELLNQLSPEEIVELATEALKRIAAKNE